VNAVTARAELERRAQARGVAVTIGAKLGLLTQPEAEERAAAHAELAGWLGMLEREDLLPQQARPTPEEFTVALYAHLTRTPAMLIGVSLAEAAGERRPQNMPGTVQSTSGNSRS
jgi:4-alpha-glucanotransferase